MFDSKESDSANPENKKIPTLEFDGKKYDINSLPEIFAFTNIINN